VRQVSLDGQDGLELQVHKASKVFKVLPMVLQVHKVKLVHKVSQVHRVSKAFQEQQVHKACKDLRTVLLVRRVFKDPKVFQE
jgi:hypothetical protein